MAFTFSSGDHSFNGQPITLVEQSQFPNASIYSDSTGSQVLQVKLLVTPSGILLPETGTPLEGYLLLPTKNTNLTASNISDIFTFIDYLDLSNRMKTDK
ncbi:MAG TPA: hypothetical protein DCX92_11995 [Bacteroidetes bacterium]|nr:hypothetical protein [Bacteroidota bacterium]